MPPATSTDICTVTKVARMSIGSIITVFSSVYRVHLTLSQAGSHGYCHTVVAGRISYAQHGQIVFVWSCLGRRCNDFFNFANETSVDATAGSRSAHQVGERKCRCQQSDGAALMQRSELRGYVGHERRNTKTSLQQNKTALIEHGHIVT